MSSSSHALGLRGRTPALDPVDVGSGSPLPPWDLSWRLGLTTTSSSDCPSRPHAADGDRPDALGKLEDRSRCGSPGVGGYAWEKQRVVGRGTRILQRVQD